MPIARDTGFPSNDAQDDFLRARRRRVLARLSAALRLQPGDVVAMLREADLIGHRETQTDAYLRLSCDRCRLMRAQRWSDETIERVRRGR